MIVTCIEAFCAFGSLFFTCEIGQRFSDEFDGICDVIDQFNWYSFPLELQRLLPVVICSAQQPVAIQCFGSVMCVRESFKKVSAGHHINILIVRIICESSK